MIERRIVVQLPHGLQARYASQFVQQSSSFESEITIVKNGRKAAAKSIMGVMVLAVRKGEEITLLADGADEQEAIETLENFLIGKN